ncbi:MAG: hypothetical protein HYX68_14065 [Planctomycetes bacterium]|nr:hypothetical protein [Planctomycetota bacterium]
MTDKNENKTAVSVTEMARMVGLSRQRFHQLVKAGVFPQPLYDAETKRPYFDAELQQSCLEVRRRNCGVNGKLILFYARGSRPSAPVKTVKRKPVKRDDNRHADLIEGLKSLGLAAVTVAQVEVAVAELFPGGTAGVAPGELLRAVFLRLQRKN